MAVDLQPKKYFQFDWIAIWFKIQFKSWNIEILLDLITGMAVLEL